MKVEAIDLFCGIGGLTCGLQNSGIRVLAGLDNDISCRFAFEMNNSVNFICQDIAKYNFQPMKKLYSKDSIKVLVGCAPCQTFSSHTYKVKNKKNDRRWNMIEHFLQGIKTIEPDIISMENVQGITKTKTFIDFIIQLIKLKYKVSYEVVNCADYGIPQNRRRLVFLASRLGDISVPKSTHKDNRIAVKNIIKMLPALKSGEVCRADSVHKSRNLSELNLKRIRQSKQGGTWKDWDKHLLPNCYKKDSGKTYTSVYGRMSWNNVSPTITTQFTSYGSGRFGHPEQDRAISIREGALLQTFPKEYKFSDGKIGMVEISRHIGNAVPPKLGWIIGKEIMKHSKEIL